MPNALTSSGIFGQHFADAEVAAAFAARNVLAQMVAVEQGWARTLGAVGAVDAGTAQAAADAMTVAELDLDDLAAGAERDGLPVPALVTALKAQLPEEAHAALHHGLTSQDVIDTALMRLCCDILSIFETRGRAVLTTLDALETTQGDKPLMGRTRMQAALPVTVAHRLAGWRGPLARQMAALPELRAATGVLQLGGPVGLGNLPEGAAEHMAALLDMRAVACWHTDRARIVDLGHWMVLTTGVLGKMGQDISLMAQQGVDALRLSGAGGSSAMPHKQNPVRAETLVSLQRFVAGQQAILAQALVHEQERSGAAWALEWLVLPSMFEATGAALRGADALLSQITDMGDAS